MPNQSNNPTLYDVLGVSPTATLREIKTAYRNQAKKYHPDVNPDFAKQKCHRMMCLINEAYFILRNPDTRMAYDQSLRSRPQAPDGKTPQKDNTNHERKYSQSNNKQNTRSYEDYLYSNLYDMYVEYNTDDYDAYEQSEFIDWLQNFAEYYMYKIKKIFKKEDMSEFFERLNESFINIFNVEKRKQNKRTRSMGK